MLNLILQSQGLENLLILCVYPAWVLSEPWHVLAGQLPTCNSCLLLGRGECWTESYFTKDRKVTHFDYSVMSSAPCACTMGNSDGTRGKRSSMCCSHFSYSPHHCSKSKKPVIIIEQGWVIKHFTSPHLESDFKGKWQVKDVKEQRMAITQFHFLFTTISSLLGLLVFVFMLQKGEVFSSKQYPALNYCSTFYMKSAFTKFTLPNVVWEDWVDSTCQVTFLKPPPDSVTPFPYLSDPGLWKSPETSRFSKSSLTHIFHNFKSFFIKQITNYAHFPTEKNINKLKNFQH